MFRGSKTFEDLRTMKGITVMSAQPKHFLTPEEYLAIERESEERHEYFDGEMFMMSGASLEHVLINNNVSAELHAQLKNTNCRAFSNDLRVFIPRTGIYVYPDTIIVCGETQLVDDNKFDTFRSYAVETWLNKSLLKINNLRRAMSFTLLVSC